MTNAALEPYRHAIATTGETVGDSHSPGCETLSEREAHAPPMEPGNELRPCRGVSVNREVARRLLRVAVACPAREGEPRRVLCLQRHIRCLCERCAAGVRALKSGRGARHGSVPLH